MTLIGVVALILHFSPNSTARDFSMHIAAENPPEILNSLSSEIWQRELSTWARNKRIEKCQMSFGKICDKYCNESRSGAPEITKIVSGRGSARIPLGSSRRSNTPLGAFGA